MRVYQYLLLMMLSFFSGSFEARAEIVDLYSYHMHPPFVVRDGVGLSYKLTDFLNEKSIGGYQFKLNLIPRKRLDVIVEKWADGQCVVNKCSDNWAVIWVNPKWGFIKGDLDPYHWVEQFSDANTIVTRERDQIIYVGPESLKGLKFAGMRGHRYLGIDGLVEQGVIQRIDGDVERDNLMKVLGGRVDATLLPESTVKYFLKNDDFISRYIDDIRISKEKQQLYKRYIMVPGSREDLKSFLEGAVSEFIRNSDLY